MLYGMTVIPNPSSIKILLNFIDPSVYYHWSGDGIIIYVQQRFYGGKIYLLATNKRSCLHIFLF